jgi:hypothetical protein
VLVPKLVTTLRTYDRQQFSPDLTAGVIVGIVALPLGPSRVNAAWPQLPLDAPSLRPRPPRPTFTW